VAKKLNEVRGGEALNGNTYPDLVKVFLTNMWYDEENLYSQVNGIDMVMNEEVWLSVTSLRNDGVVVSRGNTTELGTKKLPRERST